VIHERHRHRYEVNNNYRTRLEGAGMVFSGLSPDRTLVEMIELSDHPFFVGVQFHPELKSRPERAHPLFLGLVAAAIDHAGTKPEGKSSPRSAQQREEA
jgi:CTP synthase